MTVTDEVSATTPAVGRPVLEASGVTMRFGGLLAVNDVNLTVREGEIVGLIGPNGAGKTTFFNCLTGLYKPTSGQVRFASVPKLPDAKKVRKMFRRRKPAAIIEATNALRQPTTSLQPLPPKPRAVVRAGMARTFQNIRLFANMTALENVMVGRYCRTTSGALTSVLRGPKYRREENATRARAQELLEFVGLGRSTEHLARNMPYGDQRRLEIARALATDPKLILLDEPTAGMNPQETRQASDLIFKIRDSGLSVVVIEHDMRFIFNLCDRVLCLVRGEALIEGTPSEVQSDPRVIEAYIGTGESDDEEDELADTPAGGNEEARS
jgi:branched-chain amino acid transport system ATP-binding protein